MKLCLVYIVTLLAWTMLVNVKGVTASVIKIQLTVAKSTSLLHKKHDI